MSSRRANECPRCGFAYTAWNRPRPANRGFLERFRQNLKEQGRHGWGPLKHARFAQAVHARPWQCRCGTWLRARPWTFNWVDVVGLLVLGILSGFLAFRFPWARNGYVFALPMALWVGYRTTTQVAVEEVPAGVVDEHAA